MGAPVSIILKSIEKIEFTNFDHDLSTNQKKTENKVSSSRKLLKKGKLDLNHPLNDSSLKQMFLEDGEKKSLYDFLQEENPLDHLNGKTRFKVTTDEMEYFYELNSLKNITFNSVKCIALFIKDVTSSILLMKNESNEKSTRIYIASVTHDLRTPVNGITGMMDCIESYTNDPYIHECLKTARNSSEMLLLLIRDILDLSQIESNSVRLNFEKVNILDIINETSNLYIKDFNFKKIELKIRNKTNSTIIIVTDKMRYKQILCNLLSNALKYTSKGSIQIILKYNLESMVLTTQVKDTGIGISEENQSKLFNLFGKLEENKELNPHGVGLGLTLCKKFSSLLGGDILVKSQLNRGSKFSFKIKNQIEKLKIRPNNGPVTITQDEPNLNEKFYPSSDYFVRIKKTCECARILLVDDNPTNLLVLKGYMRNSNEKDDTVF